MNDDLIKEVARALEDEYDVRGGAFGGRAAFEDVAKIVVDKVFDWAQSQNRPQEIRPYRPHLMVNCWCGSQNAAQL